MPKAVMPLLFVLLAVAMILAQDPANASSSQSTVPQTQNQTNTASNPHQQAAPAANQGNTQPADQTQPAFGQNNNASAGFGQRSAASDNDHVTAGTEIRATLDTPLSSKTSKPGDRFTATITQPVRGANGVAIPPGGRIEGEVNEADEGKTLPALRGKGKLSLRFRDVVLPNGQTTPLVATLVSVNSASGKNTQNADNEGQVESGSRGKNVAKDVGIGAGAGTAAGLIFGSPLKGLAIGAVAGGGYVLATNGKEVNLPAHTGLVIRLDQGLSIQ